MIPLKPIRRILMENCSHQITQESVFRIKDTLEKITIEIAKEAEKEFQDYNSILIKQGLKPRKRLPSWIIQKSCDRIINHNPSVNTGLQSQRLQVQAVETMKNESAAKSAKEEKPEASNGYQ